MAKPRGELSRIAAAHGYERIPGRAERFRNPATGTELSRRQVENLRVAPAGWRTWSEYQRTAQTPEFQRWVRQYGVTHGMAGPGIPASVRKAGYRQVVKPTSAFSQSYLAAKRGGFGKTTRNKSLSTQAGQAMHNFLVTLGLRQPDWTFDIGDTPKAFGRAA